MAKTFTLVKKGYDPDEVSAYVRKLEQEINDYKQKERFITEALVNARAEGQKIIMEAERKGAVIEQENLKKLDYLKATVKVAKRKMDTFQAGYNQFIQRFAASINEEVMKGMYSALNELESSMDLNNIDIEISTPTPVMKPIEEIYSIPESILAMQETTVKSVTPEEDPYNIDFTKDTLTQSIEQTEIVADTQPGVGTLQDIISFKDETVATESNPQFINAATNLKPNNSYSLFSKIDEFEKKNSTTQNEKEKTGLLGLGSFRNNF